MVGIKKVCGDVLVMVESGRTEPAADVRTLSFDQSMWMQSIAEHLDQTTVIEPFGWGSKWNAATWSMGDRNQWLNTLGYPVCIDAQVLAGLHCMWQVAWDGRWICLSWWWMDDGSTKIRILRQFKETSRSPLKGDEWVPEMSGFRRRVGSSPERPHWLAIGNLNPTRHSQHALRDVSLYLLQMGAKTSKTARLHAKKRGNPSTIHLLVILIPSYRLFVKHSTNFYTELARAILWATNELSPWTHPVAGVWRQRSCAAIRIPRRHHAESRFLICVDSMVGPQNWAPHHRLSPKLNWIVDGKYDMNLRFAGP